jgi:hypothetical protein
MAAPGRQRRRRHAAADVYHRLADVAGRDAEFMQIAELYAGHCRFRPEPSSSPTRRRRVRALPAVLRYTDTGMRKTRAVGRHLGSAAARRRRRKVGKIPVPPKYQSKDFLKTDFWRLRGGLDVPKERWISYPGCERGADGSLVIAWAGWDHLQQATALATYFIDMKEREGWCRERLQPLLAGLLELVPWLRAMAQRHEPRFWRTHGRLLRELRERRGASAAVHARRPSRLEAGGYGGEAWTQEDGMNKTIASGTTPSTKTGKTTTMTLIRDLIAIPEQVHQGDFVLKARRRRGACRGNAARLRRDAAAQRLLQ